MSKAGKYAPLGERLIEAVIFKSGCWVWSKSKARGYGQIAWQGKRNTASRLSYGIFVGKIPDGLGVLHHCDNPACIKPSHLYVGTQRQNAHDATLRGRIRQGERCSWAKLTNKQAREIKQKYAASKISGWELARIYGVSGRTVYNIINGTGWKHIAD